MLQEKFMTSLKRGAMLLNVVFTIGGVISGDEYTLNTVSFCFKLLLVSFTNPVTLTTQPDAQATVKFCENSALVPLKVKLKYLLKPVSFIITCPVLNPVSSVALKLAFIISFWKILLIDLFKEALTIGKI